MQFQRPEVPYLEFRYHAPNGISVQVYVLERVIIVFCQENDRQRVDVYYPETPCELYQVEVEALDGRDTYGLYITSDTFQFTVNHLYDGEVSGYGAYLKNLAKVRLGECG